MTIEDLERGMKILWDGHVHSAERLDRIEALQEKAELEMAELRASQQKAELEMAEHRAWQADFRLSLADLQASESTMLDGLKRLAHVVTNLGEAQARTEASVAALSEDLQKLAKRMDAFIAALRNGRQTQQ
jgi:chromosome segregation ATPase